MKTKLTQCACRIDLQCILAFNHFTDLINYQVSFVATDNLTLFFAILPKLSQCTCKALVRCMKMLTSVDEKVMQQKIKDTYYGCNGTVGLPARLAFSAQFWGPPPIQIHGKM